MKTVYIVCLMCLFFIVEAKAGFIISKDASSPVSDIIIGGETAALGVFRLATDNTEGIDVDDMRFTTRNGNVINTLYLYSGNTLLKVLPGGDTAQLNLDDGTLVIPQNSYRKVTVKAKLPAVDGVIVADGTIITTGLFPNDAVRATGLSSALTTTSGTQSAIANTMVLYKTRPYFSLASDSPSGTLYPSAIGQLATFNVSANVNEDVTFQNANGNNLTVDISAFKRNPDGMANNFYLKDENGTTLDSVYVADNATSLIFDFSVSDLIIPAGTAKKLYIYGDTRDFDAIQLWLSDNNANNIGWGIGGIGNYHEADKIFRGNIYGGGVLLIPEPVTISLLTLGIFLLRRK